MTHLKFRYWDKITKAMYIADNIDIKDRRIGTYIDNEYMGSDFEDVVIMQSTGLTDKNGKEIYEGDILRLYNEEDNYELFIEVIFNYKSCCWGNKIKNNTDDLGHSDILYNYNLNITEIVGNIHENPELLNS